MYFDDYNYKFYNKIILPSPDEIREILTLILMIIILILSTKPLKKSKSANVVKPIILTYIAVLSVKLLAVSATFYSSIAINESIEMDVFYYSNIIFVLLPLVYLYQIGHYRILDIDLKIKRNLVYIFVSVVIRVSLFTVFVLLLRYLINYEWHFPNLKITDYTLESINHPMNLEYQLFWEKLMVVILAVILIFILYIIHQLLKQLLDKVFSKVNIDYRTITNQLHKLLDHNNDPIFLAKSFIYTLGRGLKLKRAGILLVKNNKTIVVKEFYGMKNPEPFDKIISLISDDLLSLIMNDKKAICIEYLNNDYGKVLKSNNFKFIIPAIAKDNCYGIILLGEKQFEGSFTNEDLSFLSDIADHTAVVIENAMLNQDIVLQERIHHELELARQIQAESLPTENPIISGIDVSAVSLPAYEVGGDFFDFYSPNENQLNLIIGDVSGKGTSAALYVSNVLGIVRTLYRFALNPKEMLININDVIFKQIKKNSFITAVYSQINLDSKIVKIARAGHAPIYRYNRKQNKMESIIPKGLGLGLSSHSFFAKVLEEYEFKFSSGDILVFITDGFTESRNKDNDEAGEVFILDIVKMFHFKSADEILGLLINKVNEFSNNKQLDDMTVVIVKFE